MNYKSKFDVNSFATGGVPSGPSHDEGGMSVVDNTTGEEKAEIEGGERIFSVEDTQAIEDMAMNILKLQQQGDEAQATELATQLGLSVVAMIGEQEQAQMEQEQVEAPIQEEVPMGKRGIKMYRFGGGIN